MQKDVNSKEKTITIIGKGVTMRVYKLAKELGKDSGDFLVELNGNFGFDIKSHLSGLTDEQIEKVMVSYSKKEEKTLSLQVEDSIQLDEQKLFNSETKDEEFPPKVKLVTDAIKTTTTDQSLQKVEIEKSLFVRFFDWIKKL